LCGLSSYHSKEDKMVFHTVITSTLLQLSDLGLIATYAEKDSLWLGPYNYWGCIDQEI
jgi:hypothetical protein